VERSAALSLQQLDQLSAQVRDLRVATTRQETNDLDRASSLTALSRTVDGLTDPRDEITTLRNSLDAIGTNVSAVSAFAAGLGNVTPGALLDGLTTVKQLQERLTTPTGALLDAAEIERRITELKTTLVTEDELTAALKNRTATLDDAVRASLLDETRATATRPAELSATTLTEQLRSELSGRIDVVAQSAVQAARDATGQFRDQLQAAITAQLTTVIQQGDAAVKDSVGQSVAAATAALQTAVNQRVSQLESSLTDRVAGAITAARPDLLAAFGATLDGRLADLNGRLAALQNGIGDVRAALNGTATDLAALRQSTATALANQISALRSETVSNLRDAVTSVQSAQASGLDTVRAEIAAERARVNGQLADVRGRIPPVIRGITVDELNTAILANNDRLRTDIVASIGTGLDARIDGRIAGRLQTNNPGFGQLLQKGRVQPFLVQPVNPDQPPG
ncbi:MAG TPA: hypothetical protein VK903_03915, partial [Propionicimonas sp.]|nr:hypothetical protein [Propionicimonas sp.]